MIFWLVLILAAFTTGFTAGAVTAVWFVAGQPSSHCNHRSQLAIPDEIIGRGGKRAQCRDCGNLLNDLPPK
jgi:hypothetical protein